MRSVSAESCVSQARSLEEAGDIEGARAAFRRALFWGVDKELDARFYLTVANFNYRNGNLRNAVFFCNMVGYHDPIPDDVVSAIRLREAALDEMDRLGLETIQPKVDGAHTMTYEE